MNETDINKTKEQLIAELQVLRQQIEQTDFQSNVQYKDIVENSLEGIYICQENTIRFCNKQLARMYGFESPEALVGTDVLTLVSPGSRELVKKELNAREKGEKEVSYYHHVARRLDGKEFEAETLGRRIIYKGKPAVQGVIRDVSQQRQLEAQLRQAQKMEAIGTLAGGIAHDFNNILSIIIGYTEISMDYTEEPKKMKKNLVHVLKGANRAKDLVRQILAFSRQAEMKAGPVKVAVIVKEVLKMIRASLPSTIKIRQLIGDENYKIYADPTQLHQVLMNLCTNAAHAMKDKGGLLEVELSDLNRDLAIIDEESMVPSPYMRLTVKDTGRGMSREIKERIFDPFFTTKVVGEGTGLGLSVVHGIISGWNGEISVESEPGKGTSFHLFLPLLPDDVDFDGAGTSKIPIPRGTGRILLVDDEEALAAMGRRILDSLGYSVVSKTKSLEALDAFRADPDSFQLVITDLTMPDMTGIQFAKELVAIKPGIPVIICSGYVQELDQEDLENLGIKELLRKPFNKKQIANMVNRVLGK